MASIILAAAGTAIGGSVHVNASGIANVHPATVCAIVIEVKAITPRPTRAPTDFDMPTCPAACQTPPGTYFASWETSRTAAWSSRRSPPTRVAHAVASAKSPRTVRPPAASTRPTDGRSPSVSFHCLQATWQARQPMQLAMSISVVLTEPVAAGSLMCVPSVLSTCARPTGRS